MSLLIVSYCNKRNNYSDNFEASLKKFKYTYKLLGIGEKWENFMTKIKAYHKFLSSPKTSDLICIIDCYDVLACRKKSDLLKLYNQTNQTNQINNQINKQSKVIVSSQAECKSYNCFELSSWWKKNILTNNLHNRFANSGFILGKWDDVKHVIDYLLNVKDSSGNTLVDDQLALCHYIEKYPDKIDIDVMSKYIGTVLPMDFHKYSFNLKNEVINTTTNTRPFFIHTPATSSDMDLRLEYFGKRILYNYKTRSMSEKISSFVDRSRQNWIIKSILVSILVLFNIYVWIPKSRKIVYVIVMCAVVFLIIYKNNWFQ